RAVQARQCDGLFRSSVVEEDVPALTARARPVPCGEGNEIAIARKRRSHLGIGRTVQGRVLHELLFLAIPEVDASGIIFQLKGEGAESAVMRQGGMTLGTGDVPLGAGLADDLAVADAIVLVEENVGMLRPIPIRAEGDQEPSRRCLLGQCGPRRTRKIATKNTKKHEKAKPTIRSWERAHLLLSFFVSFCVF